MTDNPQGAASAAQQTESEESAPATHANRVAIIGCGHVGMASAYALVQSDFLRELVLVDRSPEKAAGEVMDLQHAVAVPMNSPVKIINGDYRQAARSSIVVITSGAPSKDPSVSRLDLLETNIGIVEEIVGKLMAEGFDGILLVTSNPVDILAQAAFQKSGLPSGQVIGSGTLIDTARLRGMLAEALEVEPRAVEAYVIGEHGDSEVVVWSGARVAGLALSGYPGADRLPSQEDMLEDVRGAAPEVVRLKGHTAYAIGMCVQRICEAVLRNERAVLTVSTLLQGEYGIDDQYLGTPCIIGKRGVEQVIELELNEEEQAGLQRSAAVLRKSLADLRPKK